MNGSHHQPDLVIGVTTVKGGSDGDVLSITGGRLSTIGGASGFATLGANTFTGLQTLNAGQIISATGVSSGDVVKSQNVTTLTALSGGYIPIEERFFITGDPDGTADARMRREIVQANGANNISTIYDNYIGLQLQMTGGTVALANVNHSFLWPQAAGNITTGTVYFGHLANRRVNPGDAPATGVIAEATVFQAGDSSFIPQFAGDTGSFTVVNGFKSSAIGSQIAAKVGTANGVRILDTNADNFVNGLLIETTTNGTAVKKSINVAGTPGQTTAPSYFGSRTDMQLQSVGVVTFPLVLQNLGTNNGSGVGMYFDVLANGPPTRAPAIYAVNESGGSGAFYGLHFQTVNGADPVDNLVLNYTGTANIIKALAIGSATPPNAALVVTGSIVTVGGGIQATDAIGAAAAGASAPYTWGITFSGDAGGTSDVRGPVSTITASGANNIAAVAALTGKTLLNQTGTVAVAYSGIDILTYTNSGPVTLAKGHDSQVFVDTGSSGVIATGYAYYGRVYKSAGTGTYTNTAAYYADDSGGAHVTGNAIGYDSAAMTSAGTLTANFRANNTAASGRWAFLATGSANSAFGGGLRIGSNVAPVATLDVTGNFAVTKAYGAAPAGASQANAFNTTLSGDVGGTTDIKQFFSALTFSGANSGASVMGFNNRVDLSHSAGTVALSNAMSAYIQNNGNGAVTTMRGIDMQIVLATGTGVVTEGTGVYSRVRRGSGTGTYTTARAFYADDSGGAAITGDAIGFDSVAMGAAGGNTANFRAANAAAAGRYAFLSTGTAISQFGGTVITVLSSTTFAGLRLPHGTAPTSPVDGDEWSTTSGRFCRINGVTKQYTLT